jgi:hypothetical protein
VLLTAPLQPASLAPSPAEPLPKNVKKRIEDLADDARIFTQVQTYLAQAETACALERYRLARGKYPQKLSELVPEWTGTLPADPLGGESFGYTLKPDDTFVLTGSSWMDGKPWTWTRVR